MDRAPDSNTVSLQRTTSRVITSFGHQAMDSDESGEEEVSEVKRLTRRFNTTRLRGSLLVGSMRGDPYHSFRFFTSVPSSKP